ncbi:MAG: nucleotide exchange factor GrpE [Thermoanaerobaculia bacterium]|nr:nucleotide exchange factor GrpE [Thermoanaerobaculia bacterium]
MSNDKRRSGSSDENILYLDETSGDDLARALADAEKAVAAVEERHRREEAPRSASLAPAPIEVELTEEVEMGIEPGTPPQEVPHAATLEARVKELEALLLEEKERTILAEEETGRLREAAIRKAADFENLKRRTEKDKSDYLKYALCDFFRELLPVLDNFERAMQHAGTVPEGALADFKLGIQMISRQLADTLKRMGLVEVLAEGQAFNPNFHEAVMREETDAVPPGTVVSVLQRGYILNDRLLRPAMVKVSAALSHPADDSSAGTPASREE